MSGMKSVKGKIVTGVIALGLISGIGAVFANTDAGARLQAWYKAQFDKSAKVIADDTKAYAKSKAPGLKEEYNNLKDEKGEQISDAKDMQTSMADDVIKNAKNSHIRNLNNQKEKILNEMGAAFDGIVSDAQTEINSAGDRAYALATSDLGKYTDAEGKKALTDMTTQLTASKDKAVNELREAIDLAKLEIQKQLDYQTEASTTEIKAAIDAKIVELRGLINQKADELLSQQKQIIAAKATELEQIAKNELDSVISGI